MLIKVKENRARISGREYLTVGSENYFFCEFEFAPDWNGLEVTAVFANGSDHAAVELEGARCAVPADVLRKNGKLMLSVRGSDGSRTVCTRDLCLGYVHMSASSLESGAVYNSYAERIAELEARLNFLESLEPPAAEFDGEMEDDLDMNGHELLSASALELVDEDENECRFELGNGFLRIRSAEGNFRLRIGAPVSDNDAATKKYVDEAIAAALM